MIRAEPMPSRRRLPPMPRRPRPRIVVTGLAAALALVACTASPGTPAAPGPASPPASLPATADASAATSGPATPTPAASRSPGAIVSGPGVTPIPISPGGPGASIGPIREQPPTVVHPVANLLDVHDVRAEAVSASVSGGRVTATVTWWSGPAPCSELAEVAVARQGSTFTLTVREGAQQLGIACPAIAVHKEATVALGALAAGRYSIAATGVDRPITVAVSG